MVGLDDPASFLALVLAACGGSEESHIVDA